MPGRYKVIYFDLGDTLITAKDWLPGALDLIKQLKKDAVRLGIISNTDNLTRKELEGSLPPDFDWNFFEKSLILLSSEVNFEKPSLDIFKLAVERAGIEPGLCLFCTEDPLHCLVAQQTGMHAHRVQKPPQSDIGALDTVLQKLAGIITS